jgi:predicted lipoprotein with Yx(FWY)xxD motif
MTPTSSDLTLPRSRAALALALAAAVVCLLGTTAAQAAPSARAAVSVQSSRFGPILFDGRGYVLYAFTRDPRNRSTCFGACAAAWPPYRLRGTLRAGRGARPP